MTPNQSRPILAIVTDAVSPWHSGGKETRTLNYSRQLSSEFNVHIYTMKWWSGSSHTTQGEVELHAICRAWDLYAGERRSVWQAIAFSAACSRLLTARFDIVEVDQIPILPLAVVKVVCMLRRKPLVATWHEVWGAHYWRHYLGRLGVAAAFAERIVMMLPDRIIAASEGTAQRIRELSSRQLRIWVGFNGIDLEEIDRAEPVQEITDLLFVGRLLDHKGVDVLLRAVAELRRRGIELSATIVGAGPARDTLEQLATDLGVSDIVTFLGELATHGEVLSWMKAARLLVFPTRREGFGLAAVEAMACGLPVITTTHPDNFARHLVTPGLDGYLCESDGIGLPELIVEALGQREVLSRGARLTATRFTWGAAVAQCVDAYRVRDASRDLSRQSRRLGQRCE